MIGQKELLEKINNYNIDNFPRSVLLIGDKGSGKHLIANYIKDNIIKLPLIDISNIISDETISNIYQNVNPNIYLIDISNMMEKEQNILLKFIEEPLNNSFIIIIANNRNNILETVLNRCIIFELSSYNKSELIEFISSKNLNYTEDQIKLLLEVIKTPGRILDINISLIKDLYDLCYKMVLNLDKANYPNVLTITDKLNYKDNYDKYDFELFLDVLILTCFNEYGNNKNLKAFEYFKIIQKQRKLLVDNRINKQYFIEDLLTKLWKISKGEK